MNNTQFEVCKQCGKKKMYVVRREGKEILTCYEMCEIRSKK